MQLRVALEEFDDVDDWESEYAEMTLVNTVLADFCQYYGLSVTGTQFKHGHEHLHPSQVLQRVPSASTAPSGLRLSATFNITAAFHVWLVLGRGCIKDQLALGRDWYQSVLAVARSDLANSADIAQMLRLQSSQQMATPSLQFEGRCPVCRCKGHNSKYSLLEQNGGECLFLSTIECLTPDMTGHRQSSSISAAAILTEGAVTKFVSAPHLTFTHALRACVITLKLILLMSNVTDRMDVSMALCRILLIIGRQCCEGSVVVNEDTEECQLSLQLTQLVVPIMRKSIALEDSAMQAVICCQLLLGCMQQPVVCQAVACQLADTGGLSVLAEGAAQSKTLAFFACRAISSMMHCQLPDDKLAGIEVQLVAANTVHHLSGLLCLQFDVQTAWHGATSLSWAKSAYEPKFITAAVQRTQLDLSNIDLIIFVMGKLVDRQDKQQGSLPAIGKSRQANPHDRSIQTRQDSAAATASHTSQINAVKATASDQRPVASASGQLLDRDEDPEDQFGVLCPCWPTPSVAVWDDIQTTVTRAFLTLEWLLRKHSLKAGASSHVSSDIQCLMHATAALIYKLVAGHLLDRKLNMQRVFTSGVLPVLEAWSLYGLKDPEMNVLGHMLLTRMTTDAAARSCDKTLDATGKQRKICAIQQLAKMFGSEGALLLQPAAPVALGALYAVLSDEDQCKSVATQGLFATGFLQGLHQLRDDKPACFTLCACWACVASVQLQGTNPDIKACSIYQPKVLKTILSYVCVTPLERNSMPWSSECCLGLFRALMKLSELCAHVPEGHISLQMRADCMLFALGLMRQWRSITTVVDLASLVLLASVYGWGGFGGVKLMKPKCLFRINFKDYAFMLTDVLADLLARPAVLVSSDQHVTGYSHCHLQSVLAQLPHGLLYELMLIPVAQHCWRFFGQHLFPICTQVYVGMARDFMCKSEREDPQPTACPRMEPFVHMLAEHHRMQPAPGPADDKLLRDGAVAALQILYCELDVLRRLKYTLETNRTSIGRTCASGARMLLADVEGITARLESMRMQSHWLPVWAQLSPQDWCSDFKQAKAWLASSLHDHKDNTTGLSAQGVKRIQHCFTLGQLRAQAADDNAVTAAAPAEGLSEEEQAQADQEQAAWAAAEAAAAELVAEEEQAQAKQQQAAVKAAAKKAKKQQQKAKKQLQVPQAESNDQPTLPDVSQAAAATAAAPAERLSEEEQAQADQEQAAWATAEAAAAELMAEEQQAQAKQQQAVVKAAAKKAKKQQQKAKKQLEVPQAESSDQPTPSGASQPAAATAASHTSGLPDNAPDSSTDLIQAMRPVTAQRKEGVSPQAQTEAMQQQQQGLLKRQSKSGTKDSQAKPASWADICSDAKHGF